MRALRVPFALLVLVGCSGSSFSGSDDDDDNHGTSAGTSGSNSSGTSGQSGQAGNPSAGQSSAGVGNGGAASGNAGGASGAGSGGGADGGATSSAGMSGGGSGGASNEAQCNESADCVACAFPTAPVAAMNCYCTNCQNTPLSKTACTSHQMQFETVCKDVHRPCPAIKCVEPPVPQCVQHRCVAGK